MTVAEYVALGFPQDQAEAWVAAAERAAVDRARVRAHNLRLPVEASVNTMKFRVVAHGNWRR